MSEIAIKKFKNIFLNVLNNNTGYDIAPSSGKVIVFDKRLLLKDALLALIEQDSKCGVLFNYSNDKIEHIITVTDFISILLHYYDCEKNCNKDIEKLSISEWLETLNPKKKKIKSIKIEDSLLKGIRILQFEKIHRLPIVQKDCDRVLCILNYQRIFRFAIRRCLLDETFSPLMREINLGDLVISGLGNFTNYSTANINDPILQVLSKIRDKKLYCLPLINNEGIYIDSFTSSDVRFLALDGNHRKLNISTKAALGNHHNRKYGMVVECSFEDTLKTFMSKIVRSRKHCSVFLDSNRKFLGVITMENIFDFLIGEPDDIDECD